MRPTIASLDDGVLDTAQVPSLEPPASACHPACVRDCSCGALHSLWYHLELGFGDRVTSLWQGLEYRRRILGNWGLLELTPDNMSRACFVPGL